MNHRHATKTQILIFQRVQILSKGSCDLGQPRFIERRIVVVQIIGKRPVLLAQPALGPLAKRRIDALIVAPEANGTYDSEKTTVIHARYLTRLVDE